MMIILKFYIRADTTKKKMKMGLTSFESRGLCRIPNMVFGNREYGERTTTRKLKIYEDKTREPRHQSYRFDVMENNEIANGENKALRVRQM